jgi:hypothetical protein
VEHHHHLGLFLEAGVTAGEHQAEQVVADGMLGEPLVKGGHQGPFRFEPLGQLGREGARGPLAAEHVERAIPGGRHEPGGRIVGETPELPDRERAEKRVLHHVLGEREVVDPEQASQDRDHAARLAAVQGLERLHG